MPPHVTVAAVAALLLAACTPSAAPPPSDGPAAADATTAPTPEPTPERVAARPAGPGDDVTVGTADDGQAQTATQVAAELSSLMFDGAPAHVVPGGDLPLALTAAAALQLPVLPSATDHGDGRWGPPLLPSVAARQLPPQPVVAAADLAVQVAGDTLVSATTPDTGRPLFNRTGDGPSAPLGDPPLLLEPHGRRADVTVVVDPAAPSDVQAAAIAVARAAGARQVTATPEMLTTDSRTIDAVAQTGAAVAVSDTGRYGTDGDWQTTARRARTVPQLPGGGHSVFSGKTYVALYGHPGAASLGLLGEQGPDASVARAEQHAGWYEPLTDDTVIPTFELIATVAAGQAGADGDYSNEPGLDHFVPYVDAAERAGMYVLLDLQPGRTDFLTQAKQVAPLLERPHVGLALDPEWRLDPCPPKCRHLESIGSVSAAEVTAVAEWLDGFVADRQLPPKMLLLHQFRTSMLRDREQIPTGFDHVELGVQMDGQGGQPAKDSTWQVTTGYGPDGLVFGWKNFYDEDHPMLGPAATLGKTPTPKLISYQ